MRLEFEPLRCHKYPRVELVSIPSNQPTIPRRQRPPRTHTTQAPQDWRDDSSTWSAPSSSVAAGEGRGRRELARAGGRRELVKAWAGVSWRGHRQGQACADEGRSRRGLARTASRRAQHTSRWSPRPFILPQLPHSWLRQAAADQTAAPSSLASAWLPRRR